MTNSAEIRPLTPEQSAWRWKILISTYFGYLGYYLTRKVFTICKTDLHEKLGWEMDDIAYIWSAFLFAYMIGQFLNSYLGRKWGPRVILLGGFGATIIVNAALGFSSTYAAFMGFMFFNGLLQASGWPGSVGAVSEWIRKHERGSIMGIWSTSHAVGTFLLKFVGGTLLAWYGWRYAFWGCSALALACWWLLYFWQRNRPEDVGLEPIVVEAASSDAPAYVANTHQITGREYLSLLYHPVILCMGGAYFAVKFLRYALDSWLPTFLYIQGLPKDQAAYYSGIFDMTGLAGMIVTGFLLDTLFRRRWDILCLACGVGMVIGYILVAKLGANPILMSICYGLVGFMLYAPDALLCGPAAIQVAGERNGVAVAGIVNGIASFGPVVQEVVIGWFMGDSSNTALAMRNANMLTLSISGLFLGIMVLVVIYMQLNKKHRVA